MLDDPTCQAIIVTHDSAAILDGCLASLAASGVPALVVDNASRDGSDEIAERCGARVIRLPLNEGYGRANNAGIRASESEFVLVANPDIVLDPGAVAMLLAAARRYPEAAMLAPRIVEPDGRFFFQRDSLLAPARRCSAVSPLPEGDCCTPFLSGACLLIRREAFLALGGFDETIFLFYEDDDLCRRMRDAGHALVHVHEAVARHLRGASSAPAPDRVFRARWHLAWSKAYIARKYGLPDPSFGLAALNAPKALLACLSLRRSVWERYAGSAAGAIAFMRGRTALGREGLADTIFSDGDRREATE